jgi:lipoprotein-anchoring transpeptidase ErfK/SrfK
MTLRTAVLAGLITALAVLADGAGAQYYPPAPPPDYPPNAQPLPPPQEGIYRPPGSIPGAGLPADRRYPFEQPLDYGRREEWQGSPQYGRRDELQGQPAYPSRPNERATRDERLPAEDNYRVPPPAPPGLEWLFPRLPRQARPAPPPPPQIAALPPEEQPEEGEGELPEQFRRQIVDFRTTEPAGTIIIDTPNTFLYYVLANGKAIRYGIGVGREGFTWAGMERITKMAEWPDWHPPVEMIERQPYLPRFMAGGPGNPLGSRALYLGKTVYRIHGTNQPSTIGKFVSSGCIRLLNEDVEDLYNRVQLGTRVVVIGGDPPKAATVTR